MVDVRSLAEWPSGGQKRLDFLLAESGSVRLVGISVASVRRHSAADALRAACEKLKRLFFGRISRTRCTNKVALPIPLCSPLTIASMSFSRWP